MTHSDLLVQITLLLDVAGPSAVLSFVWNVMKAHGLHLIFLQFTYPQSTTDLSPENKCQLQLGVMDCAVYEYKGCVNT